MNDWVYDCETYPNVFTIAFEHVEMPITLAFEISPWRNDSRAIIEFVQHLASQNARLVGFNNLGFDYPILHTLVRMGASDARTLYAKAQAIIESQDENRFLHMVYESDRVVPQIDLFKIHHFDNKARATGLKVLEFNMRSENISDLPFPIGTDLTQDQLPTLKAYNAHDVAQTKKFYHHTVPMIRFREELCQKYPGKDWLNFNDTKIGKEYFILRLEQSGVSCYDYGPAGRTPRQTPRPVIHLKDAILSWITFDHPELQRVLDWLKGQSITETKGVFKDLTAMVGGVELVFGLGGLHGSVENRAIHATDDMVIESVDVASMYPNISIVNSIYPQHLGPVFCDIYKNLYEERKKYPKGTAQNAMLKLALNGSYGDSNNKFSPFYDPLMTMRITLSGQLLLSKLIDMLLHVPTLQLIMCNTDGIEYTIHPDHVGTAKSVCSQWETLTGLQLEYARYQKLFILNVNNYIGEFAE
jgi:DNA polymerase elongation subunit (family B)